MESTIVALSSIGFLISAYGLYVKKQLAKNKSYHAVCDINETISCTKAMGSEYGKLLLLPNSLFGVLFYVVLFILALIGELKIIFWLSILAVCGSIYLAYASFYKLRIVCPLCFGIYVVNTLLLIFSWNV